MAIICSPPCTPFSQLQTLNPKTAESSRRWQEGVDHLEFIVSLYRKQVRAGRIFLHEHPKNATSWMLDAVKRMVKEEGVVVVEADQCMFGLKTWGGLQIEISPSQETHKVYDQF